MNSTQRAVLDGIIVIDKPEGATSMDMVRLVKRVSRVKRVGHAGTLDPLATGVLPVCLGQATRLMEEMVEGVKVYRGVVTLGASTDTYDADGTVTEQGDVSGVTPAQLEALLPAYVGEIQQLPPMYSALKHEGKRLYELARVGVEVERPPRDVVVYSLKLVDWAPPRVTLEAECGRGFYMRTLAHDIGEQLGCHGYLSALQRERAGAFRLSDSVRPDELEESAADEDWERYLLPPDSAVVDLPSVAVEPSAERLLRNGQAVVLRSAGAYASHAERRRAYGRDGRFIGIVRFNRAQGEWRPEKVFNTREASPLGPVP